MNKKLLLCLFACVFGVDLSANDIPVNTQNPVCDNATLSQYNGTVDVEINWEPNVIDLRWYNGNTQITPSNPASNSCTYDGAMYIPDAPTKTGYTFKGWHVRPQYDFSTLPVNKNGTYAWNKNAPGNACWYGSTGGTQPLPCTDSGFSDLGYYEWKVQFEYGLIYGMALCSYTVGTTTGEAGNPDTTSEGDYCYCKATVFLPNNSNIKYSPSKTPRWAFNRLLNSHSNHCRAQCADWCSYHVLIDSNIRTTLFN